MQPMALDGVGRIPNGDDADKPAPSAANAGEYYFANDTQILYVSDGAQWNVSLSQAEGASAPTPAVFPDLKFILPPGSPASSFTKTADLTVIDDFTNFAWGDQSVQCVTDGTGGTEFLTLALANPVDLSDKVLVLGLEIDSFAPFNDLQVRISSGGDTVNYEFCRPAHSSGSQRWFEASLWELVTVNQGPITTSMGPGQWTPQGTGVGDMTAINLIRIKAVDNGAATGPMTFRVGFIGYFTRPNKGIVSITFDDSRLTQLTVAKPIMDQYAIRGTIYNISETVRLANSGSPYTGNYFNETQMRQFMDLSMWEMGAHAYTDVLGVQAHTVGYDSLTAHDGEVDLIQLKTWLRQQRALGIDSMALPHGQWSLNPNNVPGANPAVLDMMGRYFNTCVTTALNLVETYPPANRLKLRRYVATNTDTAADLMEMVNSAIANHQWLILAFHNIVSPATSSTDFLPTEFASFIQQLSASGVDTPTVGEVWRQAGNPGWA